MNGGRKDLLAAYMSRREALRRFLTARLDSREVADDLMQELYVKISRVDPVVEIRDEAAYLFRAAMNLARDHRRERARAKIREAAWVESGHVMAGSEAMVEDPASDAAYDAKQRLAAVIRALDELSPECRRVFVLHRFDGLSHRQVAAQLGIAHSTIEKHMHTALRHLIARLGGC